jgi:hypothetical protein
LETPFSSPSFVHPPKRGTTLLYQKALFDFFADTAWLLATLHPNPFVLLFLIFFLISF